MTLHPDRPDRPDRAYRPYRPYRPDGTDRPDRPIPDRASLLLGLVVRMLPSRRRAWGDAMRGELAALDSPQARRRFAVSSTRVALADPQTFRGLVVLAIATAALVASVAGTTAIRYAPVRAESVLLVLGLGVSAVAGRILGWPGPVGPSRAQRWVRSGGGLLVDIIGLGLIWGLRSPGSGRPRADGLAVKAGGAAIIFGIVLAVAVSLQVVTAARSRLTPVALTAGAVSGLVAGAGWYVLIMVVSPRYHAPSQLATGSLVVVALAGSAAITATTLRMGKGGGGDNEQGVRAGLIAGIIAAILLATGPMATYALLPSTVPDPSPGSYAPQLSQADHDAQDAVEVADPYVPVYLLGGLLAAVTIATARPRRRWPATAAASPGVLGRS